jgi:hypothetical protein
MVMRDILEKNGVDSNKVTFIGCGLAAEDKDSISPSDLTQISIAIEDNLQKIQDSKVVLFDTITALGVYNKSNVITEFVDLISKRSKLKKFGLIWIHIKSDTDTLDPVTHTFVDKVIEYTYENYPLDIRGS